MVTALSLECYLHVAPIGVPCSPDGTACANRIARALFVEAGVVPPEERTAAISPGLAAPVVCKEES